MPYYLQHYFMPDFNHKRLRPVAMSDGSTDAYYLGYVQNVIAGQALAELVYLDSIPEGFTAQDEQPILQNDTTKQVAEEATPLPVEEGYIPPQAEEVQENSYYDFYIKMLYMDPRFIYSNPVFPLGPNCARDPSNPNRIIAQANGYCFYHKGLITVKKLLNVRKDVSFHTGNITFVGDVVVHGDVNPGFSVTGGNIQVKGRIDGGTITARGAVIAEKSVKGSPSALIKAEGPVHLAYCERAKVITSSNLIIDGDCLHSDLFVGGSIVIKGRLQGGNVHANGLVYVRDQIGDVKGAITRIAMGYNPLDFLYLKELETAQEEQTKKLNYHTAQSRKGPAYAAESAPYIELANRKLALIQQMQKNAWQRLSSDIRKASCSKVVVPGKIYPGVSVCIGSAQHKVVDEQRDVFYCLHEDEVAYGFPALAKDYIFPSSDKESED